MYKGKTVRVYAPNNGRLLNTLHVEEVLKDVHIVGTIAGTEITTAYCLEDGIKVEVVKEDDCAAL